jgi:hypothetical protein
MKANAIIRQNKSISLQKIMAIVDELNEGDLDKFVHASRLETYFFINSFQ